MNPNIEKLCRISARSSRVVLGLMSGTSFDGLDLALCRISGHGPGTGLELLEFTTVAYDQHFKEDLKSIFSRRDADLEKVCLLNEKVAIHHASIINQSLQSWGYSSDEVDLVASHGQTIYHAPASLHGKTAYPNATLQIGDGDHIAVHTGIITVSDFRQKHIAAGGEGAPLAVYGDYLVFSKEGENRIMLNIGGIANFTWLPGDLDTSKVFSTDTGPGNTMMDATVQQYFPGLYFDENGAIAAVGTVQPALLSRLLEHPFFEADFPKTTGPELFNRRYFDDALQASEIPDLSPEDQLATLCRFSAETIAKAILKCCTSGDAYTIYTSGGGMHNPVLMDHLKNLLPGIPFHTTAQLQINPDAKEAVLFALLANEAVSGGRFRFGHKGSGIPDVSMGKICFPC
ncbi:MAG: anhydro-N-acetylmuramic acid kinase [Bacteroidetes bacterium]|nr:anhydro-N-acetylmuramic acid kinase [Bacteroidota bacterium]